MGRSVRAWPASLALGAGAFAALYGCAPLMAPAPPAAAENICGIFRERPAWYRAARRTERRWGVPAGVQLAVVYQESSFRARARPPRRGGWLFLPGRRPSTAYGYGQVVDGTWEDYRRRTGSRAARRDRFEDVADFIGWYGESFRSRLGIEPHDGYRFYLAYHEGHRGFRRGSHRDKPRILRAARSVADRAERYATQLERCRPQLEARLNRPWWWPL